MTLSCAEAEATNALRSATSDETPDVRARAALDAMAENSAVKLNKAPAIPLGAKIGGDEPCRYVEGFGRGAGRPLVRRQGADGELR